MSVLVQRLLAEHRALAMLLDEMQAHSFAQRYQEAAQRLAQMKERLIPHLVVEESRLLRVILAKHGKAGAQPSIRILQQHRPIVNALEAARAAFAQADGVSGSRRLDELRRLLQEHQVAEENIVYPTAVHAAGETGR